VLKQLNYYLFLFSTTSRVFPYVLILGLASIVIIVGMSAYFFGLFSGEALRAEGIDDALGGGVIDTLWWSMKHILDPGALSENYGAPIGVIVFALFNSVMGLIITGALIGFIVSAIQTAMEDARRGSATIRESGHYLILGWNRKGTAILELLAKYGQAQRVVILTDTGIEQVRTAIRQGSRELRSLKLLPMQGSISVNSELRRVAAHRASHIVLLSEADLGSSGDLTTIKTLTLLNSELYAKENAQRPNIVAEIVNKENSVIAGIASKNHHPLVSSSDFISKTMVQCARYPGYSEIYSELFASGRFLIEIRTIPNLEDVLFGNLASVFNNGAVMGVSWLDEQPNKAARRVSVLNPEPDYDLTDDDQVIVLRNVDEELRSVSLDSFSSWEEPPERSISRPNVRKVLILAYNANLGLIIAELAKHAASDIEVVVACAQAEAAETQVHARYSELFTERLALSFVEFDLAEAWRLETFDVGSFDVIFIVADETDKTIDADSKTIMLLLLLGEIKSKTTESEFPPVVAELLNSESKLLCEGTPLTDAIVSTEILSIQLAQLVRDPFLETLYKELLNAGGIEIGLRRIDHYVNVSESVTMADVTRSALRFNEVALGYRSQSEGVVINPQKDITRTFSEGDLLIVLAQQIYA
jgi:ion channel POLLUX/CASTOR